MSKAETLRRSAKAKNEKRLEGQEIESPIEAVRRARSLEELSATVEPLAQALAVLSDNASQALASSVQQSQQASASFEAKLLKATSALQQATTQAHEAAVRLNRAASRLDRRFVVINILTGVMAGLLSALLVSVFWLWAAPPTVSVQLDPKAVAEQLKGTVVAKPVRGR